MLHGGGGVDLGLVGPSAVRDSAQAMQERIRQLQPQARLTGFSIQPTIGQLDINPLLADESCAIALDARINVVATQEPAIKRLVIRPYPIDLEELIPVGDGREVLLRTFSSEADCVLQVRLFDDACQIDSVSGRGERIDDLEQLIDHLALLQISSRINFEVPMGAYLAFRIFGY